MRTVLRYGSSLPFICNAVPDFHEPTQGLLCKDPRDDFVMYIIDESGRLGPELDTGMHTLIGIESHPLS